MIKRVIPILFIILFSAFLILGFVFKDDLNNYLSARLQNSLDTNRSDEMSLEIDSLYNYSQRDSEFEITFLEFGSKGCIACKRMENVMNEIASKYQNKVKVVFINVLLNENSYIKDYFGIVAIPTQILLDKEGKEVFRHTGFLSSEMLIREMNKYGLS